MLGAEGFQKQVCPGMVFFNILGGKLLGQQEGIFLEMVEPFAAGAVTLHRGEALLIPNSQDLFAGKGHQQLPKPLLIAGSEFLKTVPQRPLAVTDQLLPLLPVGFNIGPGCRVLGGRGGYFQKQDFDPVPEGAPRGDIGAGLPVAGTFQLRPVPVGIQGGGSSLAGESGTDILYVVNADPGDPEFFQGVLSPSVNGKGDSGGVAAPANLSGNALIHGIGFLHYQQIYCVT